MAQIGDTPPSIPLAKGGSKGGGSTLWPLTYSYSYSRFFALPVALLFVSHPVQTEAVTYVFQEVYFSCGHVHMLSLVLYIKGRLSAFSTQQSAEIPTSRLHVSRFTIIGMCLSLLSQSLP